MLGLGLLSTSVYTTASESIGALKGRYALDCQMEKAANLSYVIGDKALVRLVEGIVTPHVSVPKNLRAVPVNYQKLNMKQYGKDQVTFYTDAGDNYAFVESTRALSFLRPDNKVLLKQCL